MSLSAWEQDALDSIKDRLASSDPTLVARLAIFARLASGEEMPAREKIQVGAARAVRRAHPDASRGRRADRRLGLPQAALLVWLVTSVALIVVALASNRGSQGTCTGGWATFCTSVGLRQFGFGPPVSPSPGLAGRARLIVEPERAAVRNVGGGGRQPNAEPGRGT